MPSPATNVKRLDRQIRELEERDTLSPNGALHLAFLQVWRENAHKDVYLHIIPSGQINRHETPPAKIVCVTDQAAARMLAYKDKLGIRVRAATEEEIRHYHERNEAQRQAARSNMIAEASKLAQGHVQAASTMFPHGVPPVPSPVVPPAPAPEPPPVGATEAPEGGGEGESGQSASPLLTDLGSEDLTGRLAEAGFTTVGAVANATIADLVSVKGIGQSRAAELIAKASELVQEGAEQPA